MTILDSLKNSLVLQHDYRTKTYNDFSSSSNNGVPTDVRFNNYGGSFNGSSSFVSVNDSINSAIGDTLSFVAHVLIDDNSGQKVICSKWMSDLEFIFDLDSGRPRLLMSPDGVGASIVRTNVTAPQYTLVPIGCTYNGSAGTVDFYIDGVNVGTTIIAGSVEPVLNKGSDVFRIGATASGFFDGSIAAIYVFDAALTDQEQYEMSKLVKSYIPYFGSSVLNDLKQNTVMYHDYRSRCFEDLSDNNNRGVAVEHFTGRGIRGGDSVAILHDPSIALSEGCALLFMGLDEPTQTGSTVMLIAKHAFGARDWYFYTNGTTLFFVDSTAATRTLALSRNPFHHECIAVNFSNGTRGEVYIDGTYEGQLNNTSTIFDSGNNLYIGGTYSSGNKLRSEVMASMLFNRPLTSAEQLDIYNYLKDVKFETKPHYRLKGKTFSTGFGVFESSSTLFSNYNVENSPFVVFPGGGRVDSFKYNGLIYKGYRCISPGNIFVTTEQMGQTPSEAAFGEWEFTIVKGADTSYPRYDFGPFRFAFKPDETMCIEKLGTWDYCTTETFDIGVPYRVKITRTITDDFQMFVNGELKLSFNQPQTGDSTGISMAMNSLDIAVFDSIDGKNKIVKRV